MQRLFFFLFIFAVSVSGTFAAVTTDGDEPKYAITADEKAALLDKAAAALSWFQQYELVARSKIPSADYRKRISPLELMQAAEIMKKTGKKDMSRGLREMFPHLRATPFECFDIAERLGDETLTSFQEEKELLNGENTLDSAAAIKQGAETFFKNELTPAEKLALMDTPETAGEIMKAVDILALTGRSSVARYELRRLLSIEATPEEYAEIVKRIGTRRLMQIAGDKNLAPISSEIALKILSEAKKHWKETGELKEPAENEDDYAVKNSIRNGMTPEDKIRTLYLYAVNYAEHNRPLKSDENNLVRLWVWNEKEKKNEYAELPIPDAYRELACRYAKEAESLIADKNSKEYTAVKQLSVLTKFEKESYQNGLDKPLPQELLTTELMPEELETLLEKSFERNFAGAAQMILNIFGQQAKDKKVSAKDLLTSSNGRERILIKAVVSPHRRVRFAALETIMTLNPDFAYQGSSYVSEALMWFARGEGKKVVISVHPKYSEAAKTAGYFIVSGYRTELALTGKEAMKAAADSPDVELVLADMKTTLPTVPNLVQELRKDCRTSEIPVAVLSDDGKVLADSFKYETLQTLPEMQKVDRSSPDYPFAVSLSVVYPSVKNDKQAEKTESDLIRKTGTLIVPPEVRIEQAKKSLNWLKDIVETSEKNKTAAQTVIYHFENYDATLRRALSSDVLLDSALKLVAVTKSAAAQDAIYNIVSDNIFPMSVREKASAAFKENIGKYGILLRGKQLQQLYDRYNASEFEPKETQILLGKIIDWVEDITVVK